MIYESSIAILTFVYLAVLVKLIGRRKRATTGEEIMDCDGAIALMLWAGIPVLLCLWSYHPS